MVVKIETGRRAVVVTKMPVLSREYLLSRYDAVCREQKQNLADRLYERCSQNVLQNANTGKTSYLFEPVLAARDAEFLVRADYNPDIYLTKDEMISAFQEKFPGCSVFYQEAWVQLAYSPHSRILKRGLMIDWA